MARPAGRYFASVVSKIRQIKKAEQIVIDTDFKAQLRANLMLTSNATKPAAKLDFFDHLQTWQRFFGLGMAMVFVVTVVYALKDLPLDLRKGTETNVNNALKVESLAVTEPTEMVVENPQTDAVQTDGSISIYPPIQTFPATSVLPQSVLDRMKANQESNLADQSATNIASNNVVAPKIAAPSATDAPATLSAPSTNNSIAPNSFSSNSPVSDSSSIAQVVDPNIASSGTQTQMDSSKIDAQKIDIIYDGRFTNEMKTAVVKEVYRIVNGQKITAVKAYLKYDTNLITIRIAFANESILQNVYMFDAKTLTLKMTSSAWLKRV